jgi:hypothetical protein
MGAGNGGAVGGRRWHGEVSCPVVKAEKRCWRMRVSRRNLSPAWTVTRKGGDGGQGGGDSG